MTAHQRRERSVRRTLAAAAGIGALAACLSACGSEAESVEVTGTSTCSITDGGSDAGGPISAESGLSSSRTEGYTALCYDKTDDPRTSGASHAVLNIDYTFDGDQTVGTFSGDATLDGPHGSWAGTVTGTTTWTRTTEHQHEVDIVYVGSGDYDGLTYTQHLSGTGFPWAVTGTIEAGA